MITVSYLFRRLKARIAAVLLKGLPFSGSCQEKNSLHFTTFSTFFCDVHLAPPVSNVKREKG